jgi:uncharacterized protein (DUF1800 family)
MDRREFFAATRKKERAAKVQVNSKVRPTSVTSTVAPYSGTFGRNEVIHLLKRTMFGAKKADVDYFMTRTVSQAVDELIDATIPAPLPPIKEYATTTTVGATPDTGIAQGTTWVNDINNDGTVQFQRRFSLKKWWTGRMINQSRSLHEKLLLFWVDHFGVESSEIGNGNWMYRHIETLRTHSMGNFKEMVRAITKDVAMLRYLNGYLNTATAPDENYARELQELFTLGKGPGSQYTESDVREAAKVLTGWQVNGSTYQSVFNPARHSTVNKQFSAFYGGTIITGRTGPTAGDLELADLLNMVFAQQEVAKFIVRKLYRFFVYYTIDANIENNIITPLANTFRNANYDIKPVLRQLFKSEHFFDPANQSCMIKSGADVTIGLLREFNVQFPPASDWLTNYGFWNILQAVNTNIGHDIGDPPNVAGLPQYYQEPLYHQLWITSDSLPKRNQFTDVLILGYTFNSQRIVINCVALVQQFNNPGNPNDLIDEFIENYYRVPLSNESKRQIKTQILLTGQQYDYYWTNAWNAYLANPSNTANFNTVNNRLRELIRYFMNLAEYQLS